MSLLLELRAVTLGVATGLAFGRHFRVVGLEPFDRGQARGAGGAASSGSAAGSGGDPVARQQLGAQILVLLHDQRQQALQMLSQTRLGRRFLVEQVQVEDLVGQVVDAGGV